MGNPEAIAFRPIGQNCFAGFIQTLQFKNRMEIAVSACLLGEKVRYDGKDKKNSFIVDELNKIATLIPFCPENLAFKTPREPISLVIIDNEFHIISNETKRDLTKILEDKAKKELLRLKKEKIDAIIFKSKSPSCALGSTDIFDGNKIYKGNGIFAKMCKEEFRNIPMIEETDLNDLKKRKEFLKRVFTQSQTP